MRNPLFILLGSLIMAVPAPAQEEAIDHAGNRYRVVVADPSTVHVLWKNENGAQLRTFAEAKAYCIRNGTKPMMVMNGGIFEPGGIPSGLCVQDGKQWTPVNLADGKGNFFLKPNGILAISGGKARMQETVEFSRQTLQVTQAVQSGPLLLRNGIIHPAFQADSNNRLLRNGVGVRADGKILFAITDSRVKARANLHQFASFFLSQNCRDALFLDGDISQMWTDGMADKPSNPFGSIIVVGAKN